MVFFLNKVNINATNTVGSLPTLINGHLTLNAMHSQMYFTYKKSKFNSLQLGQTNTA